MQLKFDHITSTNTDLENYNCMIRLEHYLINELDHTSQTSKFATKRDISFNLKEENLTQVKVLQLGKYELYIKPKKV